MVALVDCNNFYVSCERVFNPKLEGKPVIVLSNNDGCAIARSEEAKKVGIEMGIAAHLIDDIIRKHQVHVYSSNYTLYDDMSKRVHDTLREFAPRLESYSIDEAFMDLSNLKYQDLTQLATEIRATVKQNTGIPVSIGIAPTKTLAKMANRYAKKEKRSIGVHAVSTPEEMEEVLTYTEIGDVWGIGRKHAYRLQNMGINSAYDLLRLSDDWMKANMTVVGQRLLNELKGLPCIEFNETPKNKKNICCARSFGKLLTDLHDIKQAVANYAANVAEKLRRQGSCAKKVQVLLQTNPFRRQDLQYYQSFTIHLPVATGNTQEIAFYAFNALNMIFRPGYNYMKAGVMVMDIIPAEEVQQGIFDERNRVREHTVCEAMDGINRSLGADSVRYAVQGERQKGRWKMRQANLSPCYTTRLSDVPKAKAI